MSDTTASAARDPNSTVAAPGGEPPVTFPAPAGFDLLGEVGSGGMGVVFRARDRELDREVAVKVLHARYAPDSPVARRFVAEARVTARLQHPGVPPVYRVGALPDGRPFLAMKLIDGKTLDALLKERGAGASTWLGVFEAVCQAVGYAHAHGVIHRDLKPANVMVGAFGEVQVMDWGLAKVLPPATPGGRGDGGEGVEAPYASPLDTADPPTDGLTRAGMILGTPAFMAPEQATGDVDRIDRRTDVFGLGAILCTLLTGHPPYSGDSAASTCRQAAEAKLTDAFARLDASGAEPGVVSLCKWCLSEQPAGRPSDAAVVAKAVATLRTVADESRTQTQLNWQRMEVEAAEQRGRKRMVWRSRWVCLGGVVATLVALGFGLAKASEHERKLNAYVDLRYGELPTWQREAEDLQLQLHGAKPRRPAENIEAHKRRWETITSLQPDEHKRRLAREEGHRRVAILWELAGKDKTATAEFKLALEQAELILAEYPEDQDAAFQSGHTRYRLGLLVAKMGKQEEAVEWFTGAIRVLTPPGRPTGREESRLEVLAGSYEGRAGAHDRLEQPAEAVADWERAADLATEKARPLLRGKLVLSLYSTGKVNDAVAALEKSHHNSVRVDIHRVEDLAKVYTAAADQRPDKRDEYAACAVTLLWQMRSPPPAQAKEVLADPAFDPIRERDDFKKLLSEWENKSPPKPEK